MVRQPGLLGCVSAPPHLPLRPSNQRVLPRAPLAPSNCLAILAAHHVPWLWKRRRPWAMQHALALLHGVHWSPVHLRCCAMRTSHHIHPTCCSQAMLLRFPTIPPISHGAHEVHGGGPMPGPNPRTLPTYLQPTCLQTCPQVADRSRNATEGRRQKPMSRAGGREGAGVAAQLCAHFVLARERSGAVPPDTQTRLQFMELHERSLQESHADVYERMVIVRNNRRGGGSAVRERPYATLYRPPR